MDKNDLLLADRRFRSFGAIAALLVRGVDPLMRLPGKKFRVAIGAQPPKTAIFDMIVT